MRFVPSLEMPASLGTPYYASIFFDLVGGPHLPLGPTIILRALIRSPGLLESIGISRHGEGFSETQIRPLPGVARDAAGRQTSRVDYVTDCRQPECRVFLNWVGGSTSLPLADILKGGTVDEDGIAIQTELVRDTTIQPALPSVERGRRLMQALRPVRQAYGTIMPALSVLALVLLVGQIVMAIRQRRADLVLLLQLGLWLGIGGRLLLLSVLDATMFPGINTLYMAPLFPMLLAAVALALWRGGEGIASGAGRLLDKGCTGFCSARE